MESASSLGFYPSQEDSVDPYISILSIGETSSSRADQSVPECIDEFLLHPKLGMEFNSSDEARSFYSSYAERFGFRVRNSKSFTSRVDDTVIMRRFVCSKQGRPTKKDPFDLTKKRRNRVSSREGCKAMLQVNYRENGRWAVSRFVLEHCHPLGIVQKQFVLQKRLAKKPWEVLQRCGSEAERSGLGVGGGVAQSLLEYFKRMQTDNPAFFYAVQVDRNNCLANVFWADGRARMGYGCFGDAVVFDMSCKKNKRMVPFAAFAGMNHHRQLIVFGCCFITDENEASFVWLFETWLSLVSGRCPVSFVTPFNEVIGSAAARVFSNVQHRFCRRDIFRKCKENLSDVYLQYASFKSEFKKCVNEPESGGEFELAWKLLLDRYGLEGNVWLKSLYKVRQRWVPAYLRGTFYAEMPGAAMKSETMHNFFRRNSITTTTLRDLVSQFDKAMAGQCEKEIHADFAMLHSKPVMKSPSPMEKQASEIYTRVVFDLFQEEIVEASNFLMDKVEDGLISKFRVMKVDDTSRAYMVIYNASENIINCSCSMYETCGILCRHVLRVLMVLCVLALPPDYILKRWTRNAKSTVLSYENCSHVPSNSYKAFSLRCNDLFRDAIRYAEEGAASAVIYKVSKSAFQNAFNEVFSAKRGGTFFNKTK